MNALTGHPGRPVGDLTSTAPVTHNPPSVVLDHLLALLRAGQAARAHAEASQLIATYPLGEILAHITGVIATRLGDGAAALHHFDRAIALAPDYAEAHNSRGNLLKTLGRASDALAAYEAAIRHDPERAAFHVNRGSALRLLERPTEAVTSYDKAIALDPALGEAYANRGNALLDLGRADDAVSDYESAMVLQRTNPAALSDLTHRLNHMCRWTEIGRAAETILIAGGDAPIPPFHMLRYADAPARQRICARAWTAAHLPPAAAPLSPPPRADDGKIRVGYFSCDFHSHATMNLIAGLFEHHDKARFEIHAFSWGDKAPDAMTARMTRAVSKAHDIAALTDANAAAYARDQQIDIAIDLKGHTEGARAGIFAHRAALRQVAWLGYPGTSGAPFIDHILADRIVIPEDAQADYSETILYLPHSYQVNDNRRPIAPTRDSRAMHGLPEDAFVFCSFNDSYKITPAVFDIWMRLLARVDGSVLWLLEGNKWAPDALRREAAARGIDPARLIFAGKLPTAGHLARHAHADLFLDTFGINAHTTASDALWAGLPLVTRMGRSFAARVAASLLHAVDLPELVTQSDEAYEELALALARDPTRLTALRARLAANRLTTPLFDTARFTRDIEAIFTELCAGD